MHRVAHEYCSHLALSYTYYTRVLMLGTGSRRINSFSNIFQGIKKSTCLLFRAHNRNFSWSSARHVISVCVWLTRFSLENPLENDKTRVKYWNRLVLKDENEKEVTDEVIHVIRFKDIHPHPTHNYRNVY